MEHKLLKKLDELKQEFPEDKFVLHDLYHDTIDRAQQTHWNFFRYLVPSWALVFGYAALNGPLPLFRRIGFLFKTHRLTRQYAYLAMLSAGLTYYPLYKTIDQTYQKLDLVANNKRLKDEGYIKPIAPIHYTDK